MKIERFEDIVAWQKAYVLTKELRCAFKDNNDYSYRNQLLRASLSIMNNIAEGFDRQTKKEMRQFFFMSKGSASEVRSMLYIALDSKYLTESQFKHFYSLAQEINRLLGGFIKSLV